MFCGIRQQAGVHKADRYARAVAGALGTTALLSALGCKPDPPPPHEEPRWPILPMASVPDFMRGTLFERIRFTNTDVMPVYGYGLVVNLHGTGDCTAPSWVRDYIAKQIEAGQSSSSIHIGPTAFLGVEVESTSAAGGSAG